MPWLRHGTYALVIISAKGGLTETLMYDFMSIEKHSSSPMYEQLYTEIRACILAGKLLRGEKLPSIRRMSEDLSVSRTTVETAYQQLCAEGYIINKPKRGYFVEALSSDVPSSGAQPKHKPYSSSLCESGVPIKYDFSGGVDADYIDIDIWKKCVKNVLNRHYIISTYGTPQGEEVLREAVCAYARNVRGVSASPDRIVIGAGTQALLSVLLGMCGEYGKDAAIEKGFFPQGEQVFSDYGYTFTHLTADKAGLILDGVDSRVFYINSSGSIRGSAPIPINKRMELIQKAQQNNAIIIEDDAGGELRYTSKPVPAMQGLDESRVVYIGSFSKLLLPAVRISYMVLPEHLADIYMQRTGNYNQTSSKVEQLALAEYIKSGRLERQLRKLRKLYAEKSDILKESLRYELAKYFDEDSIILEVIETALCVRVKLKTERTLEELRQAAEISGIKLGKCREKNGLKYFYLSFAGISKENLPQAAERLAQIWGK